MLFVILLILLVTVIPDIIIWNCIVTPIWTEWKWMLCLPTAIIFVLMAAGLTTHKPRGPMVRLFLGAMLFLAIPKLVFAVIAWPFGWIVGLTAAAIVFLLFAYASTYGWLRLVVKEETFEFPDLPDAFDGYRILQISDLHIGSFARHSEFIQKMVSTANSLNADLIVFTGDLINVKESEVRPFVKQLSQLKAKDGVLSIMGNHDYYDGNKIVNTEKEMGWKLLLNDHVDVRRQGQIISVIGVEQTGRPPFEARGKLRKAIADVQDGAFKILLTHDPSHWRMEVLDTTDIQLTLSGHTHGGQLKMGRLSPARLLYREWSGIYRQQGRAIYVSNGLGGRLPFRLGAWPEINMLTLKGNKTTKAFCGRSIS